MISHYRGYTLMDLTAADRGVQIWWEHGMPMGTDLVEVVDSLDEAKATIDEWLNAK